MNTSPIVTVGQILNSQPINNIQNAKPIDVSKSLGETDKPLVKKMSPQLLRKVAKNPNFPNRTPTGYGQAVQPNARLKRSNFNVAPERRPSSTPVTQQARPPFTKKFGIPGIVTPANPLSINMEGGGYYVDQTPVRPRLTIQKPVMVDIPGLATIVSKNPQNAKSTMQAIKNLYNGSPTFRREMDNKIAKGIPPMLIAVVPFTNTYLNNRGATGTAMEGAISYPQGWTIAISDDGLYPYDNESYQSNKPMIRHEQLLAHEIGHTLGLLDNDIERSNQVFETRVMKEMGYMPPNAPTVRYGETDVTYDYPGFGRQTN